MADLVLAYRPRPVQARIHALARAFRFAMAVVHRQAGKSHAAIQECVSRALTELENSTLLYICPQQRQARSIFWPMAKAIVRPLGPLVDASETGLTLYFPRGIRLLLSGSDEADNLRGFAARYVVLDEYRDVGPTVWPQVIRPMLSSTGGGALFISSAARRLKQFWDQARERAGDPASGWGVLDVTAHDSGSLSDYEIASARADLDAPAFAQEYENSFLGVDEGAVLGRELEAARRSGRIVSGVDVNPGLPLTVALDLGQRDASALWFCVVTPTGPVILDYQERVGLVAEDLAYLIDERAHAMRRELTRLVLPHDARQMHVSARFTSLSEFWRIFAHRTPAVQVVVLKRTSILDRLSAARQLMRRVVMDEGACGAGIRRLEAWEFDQDEHGERAQAPRHDAASHAGDSFSYLAQGLAQLELLPVESMLADYEILDAPGEMVQLAPVEAEGPPMIEHGGRVYLRMDALPAPGMDFLRDTRPWWRD